MESPTSSNPLARDDSGWNPLAILIHVVAIALGIFGGLQVMEAITPDVSTEEPAVADPPPPAAVDGEDPDSLFQPSNLAPALSRLHSQLGAGETLVRLKITPGALESEARTGVDGFMPADVSAGRPQYFIGEIASERPKVTFADIGWFELVATADGWRWYIQFDINKTDVSPPWAYSAPYAGFPLEPGGSPPQPLGAP